jgi:hypothetical protein
MQLYRCLYFPTRWKKIKQLRTNLLQDVTPIFYENRWWAFGLSEILHTGRKSDDWFLHVLYADSLLGPWHDTAHNCFRDGKLAVQCHGGSNVTTPHKRGD